MKYAVQVTSDEVVDDLIDMLGPLYTQVGVRRAKYPKFAEIDPTEGTISWRAGKEVGILNMPIKVLKREVTVKRSLEPWDPIVKVHGSKYRLSDIRKLEEV